MKKIKLFSMLAAAIFCGGTLTAQTTIFHWQSDCTSSSDYPTIGTALTATGGSIMPGTTDDTKTFSAESAKYADGVESDMQALSGYGVKFGANALSFTLTLSDNASFQAGDILYISGYNPFKVSSTTALTGDLSASLTTGTSKTDYQVAELVLTTDAESIILTRAESSGTCVAAIKVVRPAAPTEPWLSFDPAEVRLKVSPSVPSANASVVIKGANLANGTYNLTIPSVVGLTVAPESVEVTDGTLDATVELTYTSDVNVAEANAEVSLTIGDLTETLDVIYYARVTTLEQTSVGEATTWNWANAGASSIQLTADTKPSKNDTIVLANADDIANNATFNSQALLVCGEYLVRDSKYFQGGYISFIAEKEGKIVVEFSNTGNRSDANTETRYLYVNGEKTAFGSLVTSENTTSEAIDVAAGTVEITFMLPDEEKGNQYCRVYSITYTPNEEGTGLVESAVETPATKVIRDGQLLIIRDGKTYNAQGAVVR